jgi:hypothetical protein
VRAASATSPTEQPLAGPPREPTMMSPTRRRVPHGTEGLIWGGLDGRGETDRQVTVGGAAPKLWVRCGRCALSG